MDLPATHGVYNLLEEKWIPVLYNNGKAKRVGICQTLADARGIRRIAAGNPMDRMSLLRFISALILWCQEDARLFLAALDEKGADMPENWLAKLKENKAAFNLLGDGKRFYQDELLKGGNSRPIGDLLVEFPGEESINHMRHVVYDDSWGFCPACCAMGILRFSVWAPANRYYPASVNPGSAAYAFIEGKNLFQTLCANLPEKNPQADQAPWSGDERPNSPDAAARLAWRPRKLWLHVGSENGYCANCGGFGVLITRLDNKGGWPNPATGGGARENKFWDADPHLLMKEDGKLISLPKLKADVAKHSSMFWREALCSRQGRAGRVAAVGMVANKSFAFHDSVSIALPDASDRVKSLADLSAGCIGKLRGLLGKAMKTSRRKRPEIDAAVTLLTPNAEARIRDRLNRINAPGGDVAGDDKAFLHEVYAPMVEQVVASVTPGSPFRRHAVRKRAQCLLDKEMDELVGRPERLSGADTPAVAPGKPGCGRKKRGSK